jgi:sodium transport system permease protein
MKLRRSIVSTLFRAELRMVFRDRRMLFTSVVLPLLMMPLMFWGSTVSIKKRERALQTMTFHCAVTGSQAGAVRSLLDATQQRLKSQSKPEAKSDGLTFEEVACPDARTALEKGGIQFILQGLTADEARAEAKSDAAAQTNNPSGSGRAAPKVQTNDDGEDPMPGALVVRAVFRGDRDDSANGVSRMRNALMETRRLQRAELLKAHAFPVAISQVAEATSRDLASGRQVAGLALGRTITLALLIFLLMGGTVVATDSLAGEKERGTLETLLTTAANRLEVLVAKHLVILTVALLITLLQSVNLLLYVSLKLMHLPPNFAAALPPAIVALLFVLYLPVAALVSNILLLTSGYARSYKEAQLYFFPVFLLALIPGVVPFFPGIPLRSPIVLVPIANLGIAAKEILIGSFDWPMIALSWLVTAGASVWVLSIGVRGLSAEKLITATDQDAIVSVGGRPLFERHVLRWFAALWALLILVSNYMANADVRAQLLVNLVILFFGASCLMIRRYRLDPRAVLGLRAPKPAVWLAVLCGVPGGLLTTLGLFQVANHFLPVSPEMMEQFNKAVLPQNVPQLQLLFFLTVMPGVFEEIAFRGVLLYGLRRRFHPVAVALLVGALFGIFHVALFRFVPTAFLGILLAAVRMLSGSIFPCMLWHCLSNGLSILAESRGMPETDLGPVCYLIGVALLAVSFWILWRNRRPESAGPGGHDA